LNGLSVSPVRSRGIFSTRSLMMLRWISSVPPAIELAGTDTRISASYPLIGLSSPVSSGFGPNSDVRTRAAARAMMLDASLPREPSGRVIATCVGPAGAQKYGQRGRTQLTRLFDDRLEALSMAVRYWATVRGSGSCASPRAAD